MKAAIIKLPKSMIQLSDLPPKYCILEPTSWSISLTINIDPESGNSKPEKHKLHCMQAGFQPGFAVTGQSAQGKTLPVVLSFSTSWKILCIYFSIKNKDKMQTHNYSTCDS